jgi:hypothetical protein
MRTPVSDTPVSDTPVSLVPPSVFDDNIVRPKSAIGANVWMSTLPGTEAAGEFLANPKTSAALVELLRKRNQGRLPCFEVSLRPACRPEWRKNAEIMAMRVLKEESEGRSQEPE